MRTAIFCPHFPPAEHEGGIQHYSAILADQLVATGHTVTVVTGGDYLGKPEQGGISVLTFPEPWTALTIRRVASALKQRGCQLLNVQFSPAMYEKQIVFPWRSLRAEFTTCLSLHTLWGGGWRSRAEGWGLAHSFDGIVATNSEILYLLRKYMPRVLRKTAYIPIGTNIPVAGRTDHAEDLKSTLGIPSKIPLFMYFGMVYEGKGLDMLMETARLLKVHHGIDFRVLLVGGGISDTKRMKERLGQLSERFGVEDRVIITGRLPEQEVSALFKESQLLLLPFEGGASDRRGTLMAAFAHGKAVVTTRPVVPIGHFIKGKNMDWVDVLDPSTLADKILQIHKDPSRRRRLEQGSLALGRSITWDRIGFDTNLFFHRLVARRKAKHG